MYFDNLNKYPAPDYWTKFANNYDIGPIWLVDDFSLSRSIRMDKEIFINIKSKFWKNYKILFGAKNYEESIVLKLLHEVGHIVKAHKGDIGLEIGPNGINEDFENRIKKTPIKKFLNDPSEKEAWGFALNIRKNKNVVYQELLNTYKKWYGHYKNHS